MILQQPGSRGPSHAMSRDVDWLQEGEHITQGVGLEVGLSQPTCQAVFWMDGDGDGAGCRQWLHLDLGGRTLQPLYLCVCVSVRAGYWYTYISRELSLLQHFEGREKLINSGLCSLELEDS